MLPNIILVLLALLVLYFGTRLARAVYVYFRCRGVRTVQCPEAHEIEFVQLAAGAMARQAIMGEPCYQLKECSRWPVHSDCGQSCLAQMEKRPVAVPFCVACKPGANK